MALKLGFIVFQKNNRRLQTLDNEANKNDQITDIQKKLDNCSLSPDIVDDISLTAVGVRFRCPDPECLFCDTKFKTVVEHIEKGHHVKDKTDVSLQPIREIMRVKLKNLKSRTTKKTEGDSYIVPATPFSDCVTTQESNARTVQIEITSKIGTHSYIWAEGEKNKKI